MIKLSKEQVLQLHSQLIKSTGGTDGLRDEGMLEAALSSPFQSFDGISLFPSIMKKAARLGFGLIKNHPFVDGNKRTGAHIMLIYLELNDIHLSYSQKELYTIILDIASSQKNYEDLLEWIHNHED